MDTRTFLVAAVLLLVPFGAIAAEEAQPDPAVAASFDPYSGFISRVQERLRALGFDPGPVNGELGAKTQAALAQFQLSRPISASGQLDDTTLAELGVQRDNQAAAGSTREPQR